MKGHIMAKRDGIHVWVQRFQDRPALMLQWIDPETGKRRSKSTGTADPKEAERQRVILANDLEQGRRVGSASMTWERFRELYDAEKLTEGSDCNRRKAAIVFDRFERLAKPKTLGKITERTLSTFSANLRAAHLKPVSVKGYLAYLRAALRWAKDQKMIHEVPVFRMPKVEKGASKVKIRNAARLTTEELERLLMKCPNNGWRLLVLLCWHCGMRRTEALSVRGEHIDLDAHTIAIPSNKAGDVAATAFITPELDAALREMYPRGIPRGLLATKPDVPGRMDQISTAFRQIARKAAVRGNGTSKEQAKAKGAAAASQGGWVTLHDLRRNFGSRWAGRVPAQVLQRLMRHADIGVTLTYYADVETAAMAAIWPMPTGSPEAAKASKPANRPV